MDALPKLIQTKQLREVVGQLPELEFNQSTLHAEAEWKRAYVVLCYIGQAYIWMHGQEGLVSKLPKKIAVPWCEVSHHLHLKPVICYATTAPYNYSVIDPQKPITSENLRANNTFTGTKDESWFYMAALSVELAATPALRAMELAFKAMQSNNNSTLMQCLATMQRSIVNMIKELQKLYERCNPLVFYLNIRPFQAGSKGLDAFPEGIVYEGTSPTPKQFHGASAAQAPSIHALDVFLGATHSSSDRNFLETMRQYMPVPHRMFLEKLQAMSSVHDYCTTSSSPELKDAYDSVVQELVRFRNEHITVVTRYIVNQKRHSVNPTLNTKGSGGTEFMSFLKNVRNDTEELEISRR